MISNASNMLGGDDDPEFIPLKTLPSNLEGQVSDEVIGTIQKSYHDYSIQGWAVLNADEVWLRADPLLLHDPDPIVEKCLHEFARKLSDLNLSLREQKGVPDERATHCLITPNIVHDQQQQRALQIWILRFSQWHRHLVFNV